MTTLRTGRYYIRNAKSSGAQVAFLKDPNEGTAVTTTTVVTANTGRDWWNICQLGNDKYSIQNWRSVSYANAGNPGKEGATVEGRSQVQQYIIQWNRDSGNYTIATVDGKFYWGVTKDQTDTPITISAYDKPTDAGYFWTFQQA